MMEKKIKYFFGKQEILLNQKVIVSQTAKEDIICKSLTVEILDDGQD